jgi:cell division protein FtsL
MTPPAATHAGNRVSPRGKTSKASGHGTGGSGKSATPGRSGATPRRVSGKASTAAASHRRVVTRRTAPSAPRRVSGPIGGLAAAISAPFSAPFSAPRPRRRPTPKRKPTGPLPARAVARARALPDHPLLDRIIRGRTWIALLGVMLVGIVAMQVEVLKLGASVGRSLQQSAALQSRNDLLRANVASLADDQRIERIAAQYGMVMPAPGAVVFLPRSGISARRAAANIHAVDGTSFVASLTAATAAAGATTTSPSTITPGVSLNSTTTPGTGTVPAAGGTTSASTTVTQTSSGTPTATPTSTVTPTTGNTGAAATGNTGTATAGNTGTPVAGNSGTPVTDTATSSGAAGIGTPGG